MEEVPEDPYRAHHPQAYSTRTARRLASFGRHVVSSARDQSPAVIYRQMVSLYNQPIGLTTARSTTVSIGLAGFSQRMRNCIVLAQTSPVAVGSFRLKAEHPIGAENLESEDAAKLARSRNASQIFLVYSGARGSQAL